jgi:hypothetical protein
MQLRKALIPALLVLLTTTLAAHDLFLTLADFRVTPNRTALVTALNGTFSTSENAIAPARVADLSIVGPAGRTRLESSRLVASGTRTIIKTPIGAAGTYLAGLSIKPSQISLKGPQFNDYLKEEGLGSTLEARKTAGELEKGATERYSKHVKTIFRAGSAGAEAWNTVLGYPVEIIPIRDPNLVAPGETLRFRVLVNGAKAPVGQEVLAGGRRAAGGPIPEQHLRADAEGMVSVLIGAAGAWYVKFIDMNRSTEAGIDYISQWATLTFAVPIPTGKAP